MLNLNAFPWPNMPRTISRSHAHVPTLKAFHPPAALLLHPTFLTLLSTNHIASFSQHLHTSKRSCTMKQLEKQSASKGKENSRQASNPPIRSPQEPTNQPIDRPRAAGMWPNLNPQNMFKQLTLDPCMHSIICKLEYSCQQSM
jgi:hypothetical protein